MNSKELARNLAQSLTLGPWSEYFVRSTLTRRFPAQLQYFAVSISSELIKSLPATYAPHAKIISKVLGRIDEFEEVRRYCEQHGTWPRVDLSPPMMLPVAAFIALDIPRITTIAGLADWLFLPTQRLEYLADVNSRYEEHGDAAVNNYHHALQTKKSGGMRIIEAPKSNLRSVQRKILHGILDKVPVHGNAFGFVKGRSCLDAASRHVGEQVVMRFDLKNFFPSIGSGRTFGLFRCLGYPYEVARILTGLCTTVTPWRMVNRLCPADRHGYRSQHLPQGSPASPALANLAVFGLDRRLSGLAKRLDMNYSRYADDLSFSGDQMSAAAVRRVVPSIVADEGFHLNLAKTRMMSSKSRQIVTGIVVNEHLNVDRKAFDRLKAIIHACGKPDDLRFGDPTFRNSLLGQIGWVETINPRRGQKLRVLLATAMSKQQ